MKERLTDMLEHADPQALDALLEGVALPEDTGGLREGRMRRLALEKAGLKQARPRRFPRRLAILAACMAAALGIGAVAYAEDAREYRQAVSFFAENNLPSEGLSRGEIKEVWRDITTGRFSSGKTAETLNNALGVTGSELESPSPEQVGEMWAQLLQRPWLMACTDRAGTEYRVRYDERDVYCVDGSGGSAADWSISLPHAIVEHCLPLDSGALFWGKQRGNSGDGFSFPFCWVAMLSPEGEILWELDPFPYERFQRVSSVLPEEDGFAIVGYNVSGLFFTRVSWAGEILLQESPALGEEIALSGVFAVPCQGGYLVRLNNDRVARMTRGGVLSPLAVYSEDSSLYTITDMAEFGGRIWLSAYVVPAPAEGSAGGRDEIANVLGEIFSRRAFAVPEEEMTRLLRENYTALLLVCDPEGGTPETFYSIPGCMGSDLSENEAGKLVWSVNAIRSAFFSPATSAFTIGGECQIYRYTFDGSGALLSREDTGETAIYLK